MREQRRTDGRGRGLSERGERWRRKEAGRRGAGERKERQEKQSRREMQRGGSRQRWRESRTPPSLPVPTEAARIYRWEFKPLVSYPWDHNWLMPAGTFPRNGSASQHGADLESSSPDAPWKGGQTPNPCCEPPRVRAHSKPTSPLTGISHSPFPGLPSFPPVLLQALRAAPGAENPARVPGMKSRATVTEKTAHQAGWCILRLRCLVGWARSRCCCCCRRGRLPLC